MGWAQPNGKPPLSVWPRCQEAVSVAQPSCRTLPSVFCPSGTGGAGPLSFSAGSRRIDAATSTTACPCLVGRSKFPIRDSTPSCGVMAVAGYGPPCLRRLRKGCCWSIADRRAAKRDPVGGGILKRCHFRYLLDNETILFNKNSMLDRKPEFSKRSRQS